MWDLFMRIDKWPNICGIYLCESINGQIYVGLIYANVLSHKFCITYKYKHLDFHRSHRPLFSNSEHCFAVVYNFIKV